MINPVKSFLTHGPLTHGIVGRENNNSWYLSFLILYGRQIKSNAEFCVIRENSDIIPVNRKILILIPWTVHDTPPPLLNLF